MLERSFAAEKRPPGRLQRRVRRLLQMSPVEITARAAERMRIEADRRRAADSRVRALRASTGVAGRPTASAFLFEPTTGHRRSLSRWMGARPEAMASLEREAQALLAHEVRLLGFGVVDLGPTIDWHRDPV